MKVNLSNGELAVLAAHLNLSSQVAIGERSVEELEALAAEGWRSLLARGYARYVNGDAEISDVVVNLAKDILSPAKLLRYTRATGTGAQVSTVLVANGRLLTSVPIAVGVAEYSEASLDRVVAVIGEDTVPAEGSQVVARLEVVDLVEPGSGRAVEWATTPEAKVYRLNSGEAESVASEELAADLENFIRSACTVS